ncbi:MAG: hypothetical protein Q7U68_03010 [Candidatus Roizmanbacteria bacterium]|nr:hypothetical protein [Candidatus Roizmanbacteria bacterium]
MDPILILMIAQTVIYTGTLIVLIFQVRAQVTAIRAEQYSKCQVDYSSLIRMLVQQNQLQSIYDDMEKVSPITANSHWKEYNEREKAIYNYMELNYELFERVYYLWKDKWIDNETWSNWEVWLDYLSKHPIFLHVMKDNQRMFGAEFENYVLQKIQK